MKTAWPSLRPSTRKIQASDVVLFSIGEYAELDRKLFMSGKKHYKLPELDVNLESDLGVALFCGPFRGTRLLPQTWRALGALLFTGSHVSCTSSTLSPTSLPPPRARTAFIQSTCVPRVRAILLLKVRTRKGYLDRNP